MKNKNLSIWLLFLIVICGIIGFSTWHQWGANQGTGLERRRPIPPMMIYAQGTSIKYLAYDQKNPELIAAGSGNTVKVWNLNKQEAPQLTLNTQKGQNGTNFIVGLGFSPIDNWIAVKGFWTLEIWDTTTKNKINTLNTSSSNFAISPLGNYIALNHNPLKLWSSNDPKNIKGKVLLPPEMGWDPIPLDGLERKDPFPELKISMSRHNIPNTYRNAYVNEDYRAIDFSHDGMWIAAAGEILDYNKDESKHKVKIWDLEKYQLKRIIEREEPKIKEPEGKGKKASTVKMPTSKEIRSIEFSPDNRFFGLAADNGYTIWSLPEWNIYHEVLEQRIGDIAFSPDGTMFAVSHVKGITLWSLETLTPVALLATGGFLGSTVIEFSPDGNTIAGGGYGGVLQLWDVSEFYEN